jgi:acetyltransferase-like isoleucine patch superfamily enzyme
MRNVIILGTGGCASEVTFYIEDHNAKVSKDQKINIKGYIEFDYNLEKYYQKYNFNAPVLCDIDGYSPSPDEEVLLCIADINFRKKMIEILHKKNAIIGSFVHYSVILPELPKIGIGNIVYPFCILEKYAVIGNYNIITSYSVISHDCTVGDNNFFSTSVIAGYVNIGNDNYFGVRSTVVPYVQIGNNNVIQAGMVVNKSIKNDTTVFYRYKEMVLAIPKG